MENNFDTIVAIATPLSLGAIGIIRISGQNCFEIVKNHFSKEIKPKMINYGNFIDKDNKIIDEVIVLPFVAPKSYTGENVIEIQSHGNPIILNEILNILIEAGARPAQKGEFTKRAFLNHRIDLSQAEAVLDIINSTSLKSAQNALNNLSGYLKNKINNIKDELIEIYSKVIASIDFPEDVAEVDENYIVSKCNDKILEIEQIINNAKSHNFIKDGISVCLAGKPNVGKSSLFNSLLNYNRAIVTDIAGTTRDTISETLNLDGFLVKFVDTAGIRDKEKADLVEKIGIDNSKESIKKSNIVLFLYENSKNEIEKELLENAKDKKQIFIKTKCDIKFDNSKDVLNISSLTNFGIEELKNKIIDILHELIPDDIDYTVNTRHLNSLLKCKESLINVVNTAQNEKLADLYTIDLKNALIALDEITGEVLTDNILENIFDNFCIGK